MSEPETITELILSVCACRAPNLCPTCRFLQTKERMYPLFQSIVEEAMPENLCNTYLAIYEQTGSSSEMLERLRGVSTFLGRQRDPESHQRSYAITGICLAFMHTLPSPIPDA